MTTVPITPKHSFEEFAAYVGIDWADGEHQVYLVQPDGHTQQWKLRAREEPITQWVQQLYERYGGRPVAVCVEHTRTSLLYLLSAWPWMVVFAINPRSLARYRESLYPSGGKDDPTDAQLLAWFVQRHWRQLRAWRPEDPATQLLRMLLENRDKLVDDRTRLTNRLRALVKLYYPEALEWLGDLTRPVSWASLLRWPSLGEVKKTPLGRWVKWWYAHGVRRGDRVVQWWHQAQAAPDSRMSAAVVESTMLMVCTLCEQLQRLERWIQEHDRKIAAIYREHPERELYRSLPGAGEVLEPRLLVAMGTDRDRYPRAEDLQRYSGIAPVVERSGRSQWVHWRWASPKFLRQTFHEFAEQTIRWSRWARVYYQVQRRRGKGHHAAVRALAYKWIRILYRCWKDRECYDEERYLRGLIERGSPLAQELKLSTETTCA